MRLQTILKAMAFAGLAAGVTLALGASANAAEKRIKWKMASAFPSKLVQLGTGGKFVEKQIKAVSDGSFQIKFFEPKALVPPLEIFDAVAKGAIDAGWSASGYWVGKMPSAAFFTAVPFGPSAGEYIAWLYYGGGRKLWDELYKPHGVKAIPCAIIAPEASGWFRKPIKSVADLKGLKIRFFGLGALVLEKLGASTQLLAGGDIFPALERGSIDATEYSMPAIDLEMGFQRMAKHYYFPGWHQPSTLFNLTITLVKWRALSPTGRARFESVLGHNLRQGLAEGGALQFAALKKLNAQGVEIHRWPAVILEALETAWRQVAAEEADDDDDFKRVWQSLSAFREDYSIWKELAYP